MLAAMVAPVMSMQTSTCDVHAGSLLPRFHTLFERNATYGNLQGLRKSNVLVLNLMNLCRTGKAREAWAGNHALCGLEHMVFSGLSCLNTGRVACLSVQVVHVQGCVSECAGLIPCYKFNLASRNMAAGPWRRFRVAFLFFSRTPVRGQCEG